MLIIKDLTIKDLKNHSFIENFNYSLGNRDKVGIIGEEGNGKSTFLKAIYQPQWIQSYMVMSGEIKKDFKHMGYLAQMLPREWEEIAVCDFLLKQDPKEEIPFERYNDLKLYERRCQQMHVPISLLQRDQKMKTLSGGEKVKLQMLKLMLQPLDMILMDEPTNDLDIQTLEWMETFIKESVVPILFISHDIRLLENCADVILHFEQLNHQTKCKATIFKGTYHDYVEQRSEKREKDIQRAKKEKQEYKKKKIQLNDQRNAVHDALNDTVRNPGTAALLKKKMANIKAQEKRFEKEGYSKIDCVEEGIHVHFDPVEAHAGKTILKFIRSKIVLDGRVLLYDVNLHLKGKDKVIVIGDNGSGKSVLMKLIYEQLQSRDDIRLGYMPQNYMDLLKDDGTPVQFLLDEKDQRDVTRCRELLGAMKFTTEEMLYRIKNLSEGQKAKLFLLSFIKRRCNVLLLDEPTRNLSPLSCPVLVSLLNDFTGCILVISHDRVLIEQLDAQVLKLEDKHIVKDTTCR